MLIHKNIILFGEFDDLLLIIFFQSFCNPFFVSIKHLNLFWMVLIIMTNYLLFWDEWFEVSEFKGNLLLYYFSTFKCLLIYTKIIKFDFLKSFLELLLLSLIFNVLILIVLNIQIFFLLRLVITLCYVINTFI